MEQTSAYQQISPELLKKIDEYLSDVNVRTNQHGGACGGGSCGGTPGSSCGGGACGGGSCGGNESYIPKRELVKQ